MTDECEHGCPKPGQCPLCRLKLKQLTQPWRYRDTHAPATTGVPKPIWFDALVEEAKEDR